MLGPEDPFTATSLNNLARLLKAQGDFAAQPLYERALAIREKSLGPEHPETASALNDLAILLQDQGDLEETHLLYGRALAIREKALGRDHPVTAMSIMNLAILQQEQSHFNGPRPLYERALEICEKTPTIRKRTLCATIGPVFSSKPVSRSMRSLSAKPPSPRRQGFSDLISPTPQAWPASLASTRLATQRTRRRCGSDMGSGAQ